MIAKGFDQHGEPVVIEGTGLLARAIQHETDHLDGVLFLDRLDPAHRKLAMKEIRESEWFGLAGAPTIKVSPHPTGGLGCEPGLMRVVFAGTPEVALPALAAIVGSAHDLVGVVTRPGRTHRPRPAAQPVAGRRGGRGARRTRC